jgi:hypothetical protein
VCVADYSENILDVSTVDTTFVTKPDSSISTMATATTTPRLLEEDGKMPRGDSGLSLAMMKTKTQQSLS